MSCKRLCLLFSNNASIHALVIRKQLLFACIECDCISYVVLVVHNSINFSSGHTFCPSINKCFELSFSGYFCCPAFIRQVLNRVHLDLTVIDMLASRGTKACDLLIDLGIRNKS